GREPPPGEDAEHQAGGRARIAAVQSGCGTGDAGCVNRHRPTVADGGDDRAELAEQTRGGLHVLPGEQPSELAAPAGERGEHQGAVGDALVARRPHGAADLHVRSLRRQSAPRASQPPSPTASPDSSARSSSPSGSSSDRSAASSSSRFMRKISVQSAGSLAATRVVSRAPAPSIAPGGSARARKPASSDATAWGRWLVTDRKSV